MIKRIFSAKISSITSAAAVIGAASLASRLVGVLRDRVLASSFGAGEMLDVYYASFRIPDLVFQLLVAGALSAGFIPIFLKRRQASEEEAQRFSTAVLWLVLGVVALVCLLGIALAPYLVPLIVPGFYGNMLDLTVSVTRIMFLSPILLGISGVFGGILQARKRFFPVAVAPVFYNFGIILGAFLLAPHYGVKGLALGVILGALFHMLLHLPALSCVGWRLQRPGKVLTGATRELGRLMGPRVLTLGVAQVNLLVITIMASTLEVGSLSVFNWAFNLQSFPLGIFALSFAIAAFPTLSELAAKGQTAEFSRQFSQTARQMLFLLIPSTILLIILRAQVVRVVLGAGVFDWRATVLTMDTMAFLALGLAFHGLTYLLARGFYAFSETKRPFYCAAIAAVFHAALAWYLAPRLGVLGLGLAFSLSSVLQCVLMWVLLRARAGRLGTRQVGILILKILAPSIALVVVAQSLKTALGLELGTQTFGTVLLQGGLAGVGGVLAFGIVGYFMHIEELLVILASVRRRFLRIGAPVDIDQGG